MAIDAKSPAFQRFLVVVIIVAVAIFLFFKFVYAKNQKTIQTLEQKRAELAEKVKKAEEAKAKLPELEARYQLRLKQWEIAQTMLPTEKEIPNLINIITNSGIKSGVLISYFKPSHPQPRGDYAEIQLKLKATAGYHNLGKFLAYIGNLPRIIKISSAKLEADKDKKKVKGAFGAVTYTMAGRQVMTKKPKPRRGRRYR
ncbi:hypothetical protein DRP53_03325 [candidate division WOR-3 bacterium]|uniref:Type 4a pilus biogenesis protein PilO n=1 Tax=candidate division WOR-3 bacterium TaxID=2052148 RepID=A0A660SJJ1_UNCW3|nr:MAG: hypothetical protein DRP53_03325 [candidate division WOR-3 bacterium]